MGFLCVGVVPRPPAHDWKISFLPLPCAILFELAQHVLGDIVEFRIPNGEEPFCVVRCQFGPDPFHRWTLASLNLGFLL